jgi:alkanesulfonate monooxygenase SsuD/methylene tetrahydromethanopterin reductase-like flavin-dependent oxidoreductase (luciferase family)
VKAITSHTYAQEHAASTETATQATIGDLAALIEESPRMRIGLQVPSFTWGSGEAAIGDTFGAVAKRAEEGGFYSLWVMDHFFQILGVGKPEEPMLEGYTALGFAAAQTSRIKLARWSRGTRIATPAC